MLILTRRVGETLMIGDEVTVTGKTMAENLAEIDPPGPDGDVLDTETVCPMPSRW